MEKGEFSVELAVLIGHFLRHRYPEMYEKFGKLCNANDLKPTGTSSIDDALDVRFKSFPPDEFLHFIRCLMPSDDYPSIFRRIQPFPEPERPSKFRFITPSKRLFCHYEPIYCLATDPLSRILVTGADDFGIKVWAVPNLDPVAHFVGHEGAITNVCVNRRSTLLASSSHDKTVRLWSLIGGRQIATLAGFTSDVVHYVTFSPSGAMLAAACEDGGIHLWITREAEKGGGPCRVITAKERSAATWVTFSPGGEFLAYSCERAPVVVLALKSMHKWQLDASTTTVSSLQFLTGTYVSGGDMSVRMLTASSDEGHVAVWQPEGTVWRAKYTFRHAVSGRRPAKLLTWAVDADEHLLVMSKTSAVYVCDLIDGVTLGEMPKSAGFEQCSCIAANPVVKEVFFFGNKWGVVTIADVQERKILSEMKAADDVPYIDAVWSKDGEWVFACDSMGSITSFRCFAPDDPRGSFMPPFCQYDLFDAPGVGNEAWRRFCDRKGEKLKFEPVHQDIRDMNLPIEVLQQPLVCAGVSELVMINRMLTGEDRPATVTTDTGNVAPPPLHIRLSTEFPINPHVKSESKYVEKQDDEGVADDGFKLQSDSEEWNMSPFNYSDVESGEEGWFSDICQILSQDPPVGIWPPWVTCVYYDDRLYLPQVGDEVAFVGNAYNDYVSRHQLSVPRRLSANVTHCIISDMASDREWMKLTLVMVGGERFMGDVCFRTGESPMFLMLWAHYRGAIKRMKKVNEGADVKFQTIGEGGTISRTSGVIEKIASNFKESPYECLEVRTGEEAVEHISPWNIWNPCDCDVAGNKKDTKLMGCVHEINRVMVLQIARNVMVSSVFKVPSDDHYKRLVSFPMSLTFLKERIDAGYYRSYESLAFDIRLFASNEQLIHEHVDEQQRDIIAITHTLLRYVNAGQKS